jgi:hypothetical protein
MTARNVRPTPPPDPLPSWDCQGRFCGIQGPFTRWRIIGPETDFPDVVGWCNLCELRVCSRCALRRPLPASEQRGLYEAIREP